MGPPSPPDLVVEATGETAWSDAQLDALFAEGFPPFITADAAVKPHIGQVRERFGHLDLMLVEAGEPVATGWGVPIAWTGVADDLPPTFAGVLARALAPAADEPADALVLCGAVVHPARKGSGVAAALIEALRALAAREGLREVIAPLRPTLKHRYPLVPIDRYVRFARADGLPLDPWLRLHVRLGATVIGLAPAAQTMSGTVAEWEGWCGMALPASGAYVIPGGLDLLHVDREADVGTYVEPNIWVRHRRP